MTTTPTKQKQIELFKTNSGWNARFVNDLEIFRLFDTDTIPTAFGRETTAEEVISQFLQLNPEHIVMEAP